MASSGKNKNNPSPDNNTTDSTAAPSDDNQAAAEHDSEVIYELVAKAKNNPNSEQASVENLISQVERLCQEYAAVNEKLEHSLQTTHRLSQQLEQTQKTKPAYLPLAVGGAAILIAIAALIFAVNIQRDVADAKKSLTALTDQMVADKNQTALKLNQMDGRLTQMTERVDSVFTADNLDNVLQITRELRQQINALANKKLLNLHPELATPKINLPSATLTPEQLADKEAEKKARQAKLAAAHQAETGDWRATFLSLKDKATATARTNRLKSLGLQIDLTEAKLKKQLYYRIVSRSFKSREEAQSYAAQVKKISAEQGIDLGTDPAIVAKK
jgi:hypothetical protein